MITISDNSPPGPATIAIPRFGLIVLMGPTASGKSTFAKRWFPAASIVSADHCRWMVANDEHAEWASAEAFALLETWVTARLKLGMLTVVDSTALEPGFRLRMVDLAREFHAPAILVPLEVSQRVCIDRDAGRERRLGVEVISRQNHRFFKALTRARDEGWNRILRLQGSEIEQARIEVRPLRVDCTEPPPYDMIGDIHGCYLELTELLERMGYRPDAQTGYRHPQGRRVVFVGDMVDRGPASLKVLGLAMKMEAAGTALVSPGNHDDKLLRYLTGGRVRQDHGLERTIAELDALAPEERSRVVAELIAWLKALPPYLLLDGGKLVVAHAGLPEHLQGRLSRAVAAWALYGEARGQRLPGVPPPSRPEWPVTYQGKSMVVYGHTPSAEARMRRNTICIDQGCVFGGKLTAYRYPEGELVQVQAHETYYPDDAPDLEGLAAEEGESVAAPAEESVAGGAVPAEGAASAVSSTGGEGGAEVKPAHDAAGDTRTGGAGAGGAGAGSAGGGDTGVGSAGAGDTGAGGAGAGNTGVGGAGGGDTGAVEEVIVGPGAAGEVDREAGGERTPMPDLLPLLAGEGLETRWLGTLQLKASLVSSALEEVARNGVDPRWLVYVPPGNAPCNASTRPNYLEHPDEVFRHYRGSGVPLVMEERHPGVRAVLVIGRDEAACRERFGIDAMGTLYTRTGRPFFSGDMQAAMLTRVREGLEAAGVFERLGARLLIFEAGILPWNLREQEFLARRCLPAAAAVLGSRDCAIAAIEQAMSRHVPVKSLLETATRDRDGGRALQRALEVNVRPVSGIESIQVAPFQLLATGERLLTQHDRLWHLAEIDRWCESSSLFLSTRRVRVRGPEDERSAVALWEEISAGAGAGMVARTLEWLPRPGGRPEAPAMHVRGREYLRILYGPQYLSGSVLGRLKERQVKERRSLILREWAMAAEGLTRFVEGEPFAEYHPYALGVLASRFETSDART